jgi:hypothetical protein
MASAWAERELSRGGLDDLLPNPELGMEPHSKTWEERIPYYSELRFALVRSGFSWDVAESYPTSLMSRQITSDHLMTIICLIEEVRVRRISATDPDLAVLINSWDRLPPAVRTGLVAMVRATVGL